MLPNLLVIGAAKCGTTSLHDYLGRHPEIYMSPVKEPRYFSTKWSDDTSWYEALFDAAGDALIRGESTPNYSKTTEHPETPARIASLVPAARLIYLIRDPVERIRSQYEHFLMPPTSATRPHQEHRPLSTAIREDARYLDGSRYALQIEHYLEHFGRDQLLVLSSEQLRADRRTVLRQAFGFLGVDADFWDPAYGHELHRSEERPTSRRGAGIAERLRGSPVRRLLPESTRARVKARLRNPRRAAPLAVADEDAAWMWEQLEPDLRRLRHLVGPEFDLWGRA